MSACAAGSGGTSFSVAGGGTGDDPREDTLGRRIEGVERRDARCEKNEPMPAPHELIAVAAAAVALGGSGCWSACAPTMLSGRRPRVDVGVGGTSFEVGLPPLLLLLLPPLRLRSSEFLRDAEVVPSLEREFTLVMSDAASLPELGLRCIHRSRTPATALKKFVEPAASVREIASRVGASCCSSLRSWMPSESRSPMSATTEGFSLQGCLQE